MTAFDWLQIALYMVILLALVKPLGAFMASVFQGERTFLTPAFGPVERLIYRVAGVSKDDEMDWKTYAIAVLIFKFAGLLLLYALQRLQGVLPLNPQHLGAVPPDTAFNAAASFASNTNWQSYSGETTMSYLVDILGLTVQNFLSAATGIVILLALIRGFVRHSAKTIGNFWVDLSKRLVTVAGQDVSLTPNEYGLLRSLVTQAGKVLTHRHLLREVWGAEYGEEFHMLHVNISNLRRKIETDPARPQIIVTEPGVGYRIKISE
jgi:hypothetical protein